MLDFEAAVAAVLVVEAQLSPDARQVAYVTAPASVERASLPVSALWLVDTEAGGSPSSLSTSDGADRGPRWSPDGVALAFLSDRAERGILQVYVLDLASGGAAPVRLTDHQCGVAGFEWSPDGTSIAFVAQDVPTDAEIRHRAERDEQVIDEGVPRNGLWVMPVPGRDAGAADRRQPKRLSPEGMHIVHASLRGVVGFGWAPDGTELVAATAKSPKATDAVTPELIAIDLDGAVRHLADYESYAGTPRFSPDGTTIGFNGAEGGVPALFALQTVARAGGQSDVVMPGYDGSFYDFDWLPDGRLVAVSEERQDRRLVVIDPERRTATDAVAPCSEPGAVSCFSVSADGRKVAFVRGDVRSYGDLFVAELGRAPRRLTDVNPWLRECELGEVREISWASFDGLEIEGLLILPVGYREGERYPMLLNIHGGPEWAYVRHLGHSATATKWGQFMAQRGYAVLLPNPRGSSGRGAEFLSGIVGCWGDPDYRDLMAGVDHVIALGIADPEKLVVGGWSGGGYLTNWAITHTDRFKAAVSGAGISNWVSFQGTSDARFRPDRIFGVLDEHPDTHWEYSPIRYVNAATTPTLILYGELDQRCPASQGHELYEGLKSRGVETQLVIYPREGHDPVERRHQLDVLQRVVDWFERHLGLDASSAAAAGR